VAAVVQLFVSSVLQDIVDHGGDVDGTDLMPVKVPELVAVQRDEVVLPGVDVTTGIA